MSSKKPLWIYVTAVIITLIVINLVGYFIVGTLSQALKIFSLGYIIGMIAMYIAVHVYESKAWPIKE